MDEILAFVTKMKPDDVVLTTSDQMVYVGDVSGGWTWQASEDRRSNLRRPVDWRNIETPLDFAELPNPLPAKLASGANIVDLTSELEVIDKLTEPPEPDERTPGEPKTVPDHEPFLSRPLLWRRSCSWTPRGWRVFAASWTSDDSSSSTARLVQARPIWLESWLRTLLVLSR